MRTLPEAGVRDVRHPVLRSRQTQRALRRAKGPSAEEARRARQRVGKGKHYIFRRLSTFRFHSERNKT